MESRICSLNFQPGFVFVLFFFGFLCFWGLTFLEFTGTTEYGGNGDVKQGEHSLSTSFAILLKIFDYCVASC